MYAIIVDGGRQYRVEAGQELRIDYRASSNSGDQLVFDRVLAVSGEGGVQLGAPHVEGASVAAEVLGVKQGKKITVQKLRRRKNSRRKTGHRQLFTNVRISEILTDGQQPAPPAAAESSEEPEAADSPAADEASSSDTTEGDDQE